MLVDYLQKWKHATDGAEKFCWMRLTEKLEWKVVKESAKFASAKLGDLFTATVNIDDLHDELALIESFVDSQIPSWQMGSVSSQDRWLAIFYHASREHLEIKNLQLFVELIFSLPGTSTEAERTFSFLKRIWGDDKGQMCKDTVESVLFAQYNMRDVSCVDFYESIKDNKKLLESVMSSSKYK